MVTPEELVLFEARFNALCAIRVTLIGSTEKWTEVFAETRAMSNVLYLTGTITELDLIKY